MSHDVRPSLFFMMPAHLGASFDLLWYSMMLWKTTRPLQIHNNILWKKNLTWSLATNWILIQKISPPFAGCQTKIWILTWRSRIAGLNWLFEYWHSDPQHWMSEWSLDPDPEHRWMSYTKHCSFFFRILMTRSSLSMSLITNISDMTLYCIIVTL